MRAVTDSTSASVCAAPCVSVCMPCHNGAAFIESAIQSVLGQSFCDFELLVVDDGSIDNTLDIVRQIDDPRIRIERNADSPGLPGNWNKCLELACGTYIRYLFQDDIMEPESLQVMVDFMQEHPSAALVFGSSKVIDETGKTTMTRRPFKKTELFEGKAFARRAFCKHNVYGEPSNILFRKDIAVQTGFFNEALPYSPDWEYWSRLSVLGDVGYVDVCTSRFRVSADSATSSLYKSRKAELEEDDRIFVETLAAIPELGISSADIQAHNRSTKWRNRAKQLYFLLRGK